MLNQRLCSEGLDEVSKLSRMKNIGKLIRDAITKLRKSNNNQSSIEQNHTKSQIIPATVQSSCIQNCPLPTYSPPIMPTYTPNYWPSTMNAHTFPIMPRYMPTHVPNNLPSTISEHTVPMMLPYNRNPNPFPQHFHY